MRKALLTIFLISISVILKAQCNCEKINRQDGTQVTQCEPKMVAYDNSSQVGIAAASNGMDDFLTITVRFKSSSKKVKSDLSIRLKSNDMINLELVNSQLAYMGNSEVAQAIYMVDNSALKKLSSSNIKTLSFKLSEDVMRTYQIKRNSNILNIQLNCI